MMNKKRFLGIASSVLMVTAMGTMTAFAASNNKTAATQQSQKNKAMHPNTGKTEQKAMTEAEAHDSLLEMASEYKIITISLTDAQIKQAIMEKKNK